MRIGLVVFFMFAVVLTSCATRKDPASIPQPPADPVLVTPVDTTVIAGEVEFSWNVTTGSVCEVELDNASSFLTPIVSVTVTGSATSITVSEGGEYWWRVRARSSESDWSGWTVGSFVADDSPFDLIGEFLTIGEPEGMFVQDNVGYVAQGVAGVDFIDLSNPTSPSRITIWDDPEQNYSYWAVGQSDDSLLYVADGYEGIKLVDTRDPQNPVFGYETTDRDVRYVSILRNEPDTLYVYRTLILALSTRGTVLVREAHWEFFAGQYLPFSNLILADTSYLGGLQHAAAVGDTFYLANSYYGFRVITLSDLLEFTELGWVDTPGEARRVAVHGSYAFVACDRAGLVVIDVSNPSAPVVIGQFDTVGRTYDVLVADDGQSVYLADGSQGLRWVDVSDPSNPSVIGSYNTGYANALASSAGVIYVLDRDRGIIILTHRD